MYVYYYSSLFVLMIIQMLQAAANVTPRGVYVCGNTTTTSGLTVTLTKEGGSGDFALEAGALVLADQGQSVHPTLLYRARNNGWTSVNFRAYCLNVRLQLYLVGHYVQTYPIAAPTLYLMQCS